MDIIEQFIKEKDLGITSKVDARSGQFIRDFSDYLTANGYQIVKKEENSSDRIDEIVDRLLRKLLIPETPVKKECEHKNGGTVASIVSFICRDCGAQVSDDAEKRVLVPPETPTLPEKNKLTMMPSDYWVSVSGLKVENTSKDMVIEVELPDSVTTYPVINLKAKK